MSEPPITIAGCTVPAGRMVKTEIEFGNLPTGTPLPLPLVIAHGRNAGPRLWLSAALHGDEVNGVEIIRQVMETLDPRTLSGTVVGVPIVNVFGFVGQTRALPDGRDLNRSFPGSPTGSLAARLAHTFLEQIALQCTHGIDLHTGSGNRTNLPHIRADLQDPETQQLAAAFGTGLIVDANVRDGSLRLAAAKHGIPCLLYEGGEANRLERTPIRAGVRGVKRVMQHLGMLPGTADPLPDPVHISKSRWIRARRAGMLRIDVDLGDEVVKGKVLGVVRDGQGDRVNTVRAPADGIVLGVSLSPIVYRGDALVHLAFPA